MLLLHLYKIQIDKMQLISNGSITILICGFVMLLVASFLILVGFQSALKKRIYRCSLGYAYVVVVVSIALCLTEKHWMDGSVRRVKTRVWASDVHDTVTDVGLHLGLRGVNITIMTSSLGFNEEFDWAWGTKMSIYDNSNPFKRMLTTAAGRGIPLPIQDVAEKFETYGVLGSASAGIGLHEAGYYTNMFLTIALSAWVMAGLVAPLSQFACCYSALITFISLLCGTLVYVIINASGSVIEKSKIRFRLSEPADSEYITLSLKYAWCFYVNAVLVVVTGVMVYVMNKEAKAYNKIQLRRLQDEMNDEAELKASMKQNKEFMKKDRLFKRRLTAQKIKVEECFDQHHTMTAIPMEPIHVQEYTTVVTHGTPKHVPACSEIVMCDVEYTGPQTTMLYVNTSPPERGNIQTADNSHGIHDML